MKKVGICISGYGDFAKKQIHPRLEKIDGCEVKYFYHPEKTKAEKYGPLGTSDLEAVLNDEAIDAFVIASPNDRHFGLLCKILWSSRPKHIFVEKPMTNNLREANIVEEMLRKEKVFMVGHCHRRYGVYRKAKQLLDEGAIGKVVSADFNYSSSKVFTIREDEWRASAARTDLGPLTMVGTHCFDTIHYLFGKVRSVYAELRNITGKTESPDASAAFLKMESGATVLLQCNYNTPIDRYYHIFGTDGAIYIDRDRIWLRQGREDYLKTEADRRELLIDKVDPITEELKEFINAIQHGTGVETGYQEGLEVMKVMEGCRVSWLKDKPQRLF